MKVLWTRTAVGHLQAIHDQIAQNSAVYARRMIDRITKRSQRLAKLPFAGQIVLEFEVDDIREVYVKPYRIIYRVGPEQIEILAVVHGAQQVPSVD